MAHQKGELNSPKIWSRIKSAFKGSRPDKDIWEAIEDMYASIDHLIRALISHNERIDKMSVDLSKMAVEVAELKGSFARLIELVAKLKEIIAGNGDAQAKVDAMTAELDDIQKAAEAAADEGGSQGGIV